jgi:hypothetical protein
MAEKICSVKPSATHEKDKQVHGFLQKGKEKKNIWVRHIPCVFIFD